MEIAHGCCVASPGMCNVFIAQIVLIVVYKTKAGIAAVKALFHNRVHSVRVPICNTSYVKTVLSSFIFTLSFRVL